MNIHITDSHAGNERKNNSNNTEEKEKDSNSGEEA